MDDPWPTTSSSSSDALSREAMSDIETVAKGGATQIAGQITHRSLSFFLNLIAFRMLGPVSFGLYRVVTQTLAIASEVGTAGFHYATLRYTTVARAREDHAGVIGSIRGGLMGAAVASLATCAIVMLLAEPLGTVLGDTPAQDDRLTFLLRLGALYVPAFALMQVLRYSTQAYKTMVPSVVIGHIVQPVVQFVVGVGLLIAGLAVAGAVTGLVAGTAVAVLVGAILLRNVLTDDERGATPRIEPAKMLRFALPQAGSLLLSLQTLGLGVILLGAWSSSAQVGLFAAALALQGPAGVFQAGTVSIWAPMVSDLHERGEPTRLEGLYKTLTRWIATFSLPISAAMIIEAELFARMFGGDQASDAAPVVAVLAAGNMFATTFGPSVYMLTMTGRPGLNLANSVGAVAVYVVGAAIVVDGQGALGMAWVDAIVTALLATVRVIEVKRVVGVQPLSRSLLKPFAATATGATWLLGVLWLVPEDIIWELAGLVSAFGVYLVALLALGIDREESHLWRMLKSKLRRRD